MAMPQQAGVSGLDGQQNLLATVSGNVQKYAAKKKKVLTAEEMELYELTQAAGIVMDQEVFKIIVDLLKMNVAPLAVFQMLKAMCAGHSIAEMSSAEAVSTMTRSNLADSREHSFISAKNSKIPALSFSSALRPPRLATKMVVYNPADACSPLSQVRNKSNAAISGSQLQTERSSSREGSSQRVPRQPSATRAPKGSSTGKNTAGGSSTQPQSGL
ncbi:mitotic-spindle organizing protein 2 isoform X2 [Callorhinchus milii]|uniref:Mitotic spindle organizing protein 2B n=1 Tax=Callorhinchus milii TaxID=7868 RepID=A0A4W3IJ90_CALMI|nr:mitotic-spindle organizing protein 2 isoform X2 [Callorhinchus milii]|eukprot:gi/632979811/ref/XP_007906679.1/ PREDICTED: mitotic-spindle organizing protein 2B-like isoform X2 [Callorhinchus milii]